MLCPKCNSECDRDEVDIGVGIQHSPWRCANCGWNDEEIDWDAVETADISMDPQVAFRVLVESLHCVDLAAYQHVDDKEFRANALNACRELIGTLESNRRGFDVQETIQDLVVVMMNKVRV